jgi:Na+/H+ antiporter NhaD/arsenite permease-like protein
MTDLQIYLTIAIFAVVIAAIAFDLIDMALATLIGVCLMIAAGILNYDDFVISAQSAGGPLSLLFGGMVVAHVLERTGSSTTSAHRCCAQPAAAASVSCCCSSCWLPASAPYCRTQPP